MNDWNVILLLWALPIAFGLHVFEEFIFPGGLLRWMRAYKSYPMSDLYYGVLNIVAWIGALLLPLKPGATAMYLCLGFTGGMAGNALSHLRATLQTKHYCPGTISGVGLLLPLFIVSHGYLLTRHRIDWHSIVIDFGFGVFLGFHLFAVHITKADEKRVGTNPRAPAFSAADDHTAGH